MTTKEFFEAVYNNKLYQTDIYNYIEFITGGFNDDKLKLLLRDLNNFYDLRQYDIDKFEITPQMLDEAPGEEETKLFYEMDEEPDFIQDWMYSVEERFVNFDHFYLASLQYLKWFIENIISDKNNIPFLNKQLKKPIRNNDVAIFKDKTKIEKVISLLKEEGKINDKNEFIGKLYEINIISKVLLELSVITKSNATFRNCYLAKMFKVEMGDRTARLNVEIYNDEYDFYKSVFSRI